jgi:hypothetical protein
MHVIFSNYVKETAMDSINRSFLGLGAVLAALTTAGAHASPAPHAAHVLGFEDPQTGKFHPLPMAVADAATAPTTGTVEVSFNIKLVTAFAKGSTLTCGIFLSGTVENSVTGAGYYYEDDGNSATVNGSTATCTATIPYSWLVPFGSVQTFTGTYMVSIYGAVPAGAQLITPSRDSEAPFLSANAIPPSGTVSKYTVNVTL